MHVGVDVKDHAEIWLEPIENVNENWGRQWSEDNPWSHRSIKATRYVRADLLEAVEARLAAVDRVLNSTDPSEISTGRLYEEIEEALESDDG